MFMTEVTSMVQPALHDVSQTNEKIHPIFDFFYKEKYLTQNLGHFAPSKKGLIKIGSQIHCSRGLLLGTFCKP